jgi:hypothetical protein
MPNNMFDVAYFSRSDIRGVCVSEDGLLVATCGSDGLKLWNSSNLSHTRSCRDAGNYIVYMYSIILYMSY